MAKPTEISKERMASYLMRGMAARAMINKREFTDEEAAAHNAIRALIENSGPDDKFIRHIQGHLKPGQKVICKICGKTAEEIINEIP